MFIGLANMSFGGRLDENLNISNRKYKQLVASNLEGENFAIKRSNSTAILSKHDFFHSEPFFHFIYHTHIHSPKHLFYLK